MVDENEFFRQVTVRMASSLELEVALRRTVAYLETLMPVQLILVAIVEPSLGGVRLMSGATALKGKRLDILLPLSRQVRSLLEEVWHRSEGPDVLFVNQIRDDLSRPLLEHLSSPAHQSLFRPMVEGLELTSDPERTVQMVRLLVVAGQRIAALALGSLPDRTFDKEHVRLFELMNEPCAIAVSNALKLQELQRLQERLREENQFLRRELGKLRGEEILGADGGLRGVMELVRRVAPLDAPVLLLGETGVGKEVLAAAVHRGSSRREGPFVNVNCGAIPEALIDSELFGHERGAFTGAAEPKQGRFERAQGGTIFLDEIGELPLGSQVRLLQVLQSKEIERVGGQRAISLDLRVVAATNRDLRAMVEEGRFRQDLWFRLDVFPIVIPPLRGRLEDIPALVGHFLQVKAAEQRLSEVPELAPGAIDQLLAYRWPGNVRELANVIERAMILRPEGPLSFGWLEDVRCAAQPPGCREVAARSLDEVVAEHLSRVLGLTGGRIAGPGAAAELLGVHPNTLRHRLRKLGIPFGRTVKRDKEPHIR